MATNKGYNHHVHHRNLELHYKRPFTPRMCSRPTLEDVAIPRLVNRSISFSNDPLSPKISCMGQVKRNNKVIGLSTPVRLSIIPKSKGESTNSFKYFKLNRIFAGKNLASKAITTTTTNTIRTRASSCREKEAKLSCACASGPKVHVSIEDMDPPLPVIKKVAEKQVDGEGVEVDNLWKRRFGGVELKGLKLQ